MNAQYQTLVSQFGSQKVLVIGELMLDVYLSGTSSRICREAPVPIVDIQQREEMPGGAANAAVNLAAMGAQAVYLTVTGDDAGGRRVARLLREAGVDTTHIILTESRETLTKKRVVSNGQLLVRYDEGSTMPLEADIEQQLIDKLQALYPLVDAVLVSDYGYGIVSDNVLTVLKSLRERDPQLLVVDSKHLARFRDLQPDAIKPNYGEAVQLLGLEKEANGRRVDQILNHGIEMLEITGASVAAVTVDTAGAVILERGKSPYRTYARPVPDSKAAGAGDTYVSALTLGLALKLMPLQAAEIAAAAASVVVHKEGTATCSRDELIQYFSPPQKVVKNTRELADRVRAYREQGRTIVFTNGCFDILHRGHITYLAQAKALGDILIVAVNSDDSVKRLKGPERPINTLEDRLHVLAALDSVDHVVSFDANTPVELIEIVAPHVYVKGGDYNKASLPEAETVERLGGTVEIVPYITDQSTTNVIARIQAQQGIVAAGD